MSTNVSGDVVKTLRLERGWTQEQLAHLAGINVRTIQRVEKTGICDLETRSALAAVFQVDFKQLVGETKIEQTKPSDDPALLFYSRIISGTGLVQVFDGSLAYRFSHEDPRSADDAEYIAWFTDQIHDYADCWSDMDPGAKVRATFEFGEMLKDMTGRGFALFGLRTRSQTQLPSAGGPPSPFEMKIANFHVAYSDSNRIIVLDPCR
jgi:transcriptional regulator with XRE-family HTH domain